MKSQQRFDRIFWDGVTVLLMNASNAQEATESTSEQVSLSPSNHLFDLLQLMLTW